MIRDSLALSVPSRMIKAKGVFLRPLRRHNINWQHSLHRHLLSPLKPAWPMTTIPMVLIGMWPVCPTYAGEIVDHLHP